jgi:predicted RNA-binding Zn-ribbon protein involved in translation (DUF1610 family)
MVYPYLYPPVTCPPPCTRLPSVRGVKVSPNCSETITPSAGFHKNLCRLRRRLVSLQGVVMERKERMLECPECGELTSARLLDDLNKCDNCGCHARFFKFCPPRPTDEYLKTCHRENCTYPPEYEIFDDIEKSPTTISRGDKNKDEEIITWTCPCGHTNNSVELYDRGRDWPWYIECSKCGWEQNA